MHVNATVGNLEKASPVADMIWKSCAFCNPKKPGIIAGNATSDRIFEPLYLGVHLSGNEEAGKE